MFSYAGLSGGTAMLHRLHGQRQHRELFRRRHLRRRLSARYALTDTIVAGNAVRGTQRHRRWLTPCLAGTYNLIGTGGSGGLTTARRQPARRGQPTWLAPLGNYGGPTETMALLPGSPAIGAGIAVERHHHRPARRAAGFAVPTSAPSRAKDSQSLLFRRQYAANGHAGTEFGNVLAVTVTANNPLEPVAGGVVNFAAPSIGASAILWSSSSTSTAMARLVFATANTTPGGYVVTASADGATTPASFDLTNSPVSNGATPDRQRFRSNDRREAADRNVYVEREQCLAGRSGGWLHLLDQLGRRSPVQLVWALRRSGDARLHHHRRTIRSSFPRSAILSNTTSLTAIQTVQVVPYALVPDAANPP